VVEKHLCKLERLAKL